MGMKSLLKKINDNPYCIFIIAIPSVLEIGNLIKNAIKMNTILDYYRYSDWVNPIIQLIVIVLLYLTLKRNRLLKEKQIADTQSLENYKQSKGNIDSMMMRDYSTCLQAFIAYLNSFTDPKDLDAIANILFERRIQIPDCERIGMSAVLVASMRKLYHADEMQKQDDILKQHYKQKNENGDSDKPTE
jgi:uncharacterized protein YfaS (alpha-2-macroglobulin family)